MGLRTAASAYLSRACSATTPDALQKRADRCNGYEGYRSVQVCKVKAETDSVTPTSRP